MVDPSEYARLRARRSRAVGSAAPSAHPSNDAASIRAPTDRPLTPMRAVQPNSAGGPFELLDRAVAPGL
jgi:hypothetical protein